MAAKGGSAGLFAMDLNHLEKQVPELSALKVNLSSISVDDPIDSSDMHPSNWTWLADTIGAHYNDFDGFVVLHGSDTMSYTASALSFMLHGLNKPVVFTGAQLPIGVLRSDARENLLTAIEIAGAVHPDGKPMVPEVSIYFEYGLYRGNRTTKVSAERFEAFRSPNYPMLAEAGVHLRYDLAAIKDINTTKFEVRSALETGVGLVKLFPGMSPASILGYADSQSIRAIVLETFGSGNATTSEEFLRVLGNLLDKGITLVNVTQCIGGMVQMGKYKTSEKMKAMGVLSGGDMTTEAALTKLMYLLANGCDSKGLEEHMPRSLNGELTQDLIGVVNG